MPILLMSSKLRTCNKTSSSSELTAERRVSRTKRGQVQEVDWGQAGREALDYYARAGEQSFQAQLRPLTPTDQMSVSSKFRERAGICPVAGNMLAAGSLPSLAMKTYYTEHSHLTPFFSQTCCSLLGYLNNSKSRGQTDTYN